MLTPDIVIPVIRHCEPLKNGVAIPTFDVWAIHESPIRCGGILTALSIMGRRTIAHHVTVVILRFSVNYTKNCDTYRSFFVYNEFILVIFDYLSRFFFFCIYVLKVYFSALFFPLHKLCGCGKDNVAGRVERGF